MNTLYMCYFGVREPLVQTQVLPYLRALAAAGIGTHLLTFEPAGRRGCHRREEQNHVRGRLAADGITWHRLRYHQRPSVPATLFDVAVGTAAAGWLAYRYGIDVLHARSHVPGLMALLLKQRMGQRFLFDFRGLMADEYADAGRWSRAGAPFRVMKRLEETLLAEADAVVVLTERIRAHLFTEEGVFHGDPLARRRPVAVIPCCVELGRFAHAHVQRERIRRELGLGTGTVLAYLGTLGGYYMTEELADLTAAALRVEPEAKLLALSKEGHSLLSGALERRGVPAAAYRIRAVDPAVVPAYLGAADIGISFREATFATSACSPTKVAEYLAAGLPVLSNVGVGDTEAVLRDGGVGLVLDALTDAAYESAFREVRSRLGDSLRERCRHVARQLFDLETVGGPAYVRLYEALERGQTTALREAGAGARVPDPRPSAETPRG